MERDKRFEVSSDGNLVIGEPITLKAKERKVLIEKMFSINGWNYELLTEYSSSHYYIQLRNNSLEITKRFHLYHGNVRKEDPDRNREEKKIQLGTENDPREYKDDALILGFYVYENKDSLSDTVVVAWPIEDEKNYPANPSLRVNMKTDIIQAKNIGYYVDNVTGKKLVVFRPEFIYYYINNYKKIQYSDELDSSEVATDIPKSEKLSIRHTGGTNILFYGVPGSGKSHTIDSKFGNKNMTRVVFHPDFMNTDFIGQILPRINDDETVTYEFKPGPFTKVMKQAYEDPDNMYYLIIEEINRGNAPAIFGEIFQLLDRTETGESKYSVVNYDVSKNIYGEETVPVKIPSNLTLIATMNTSDQNVFTLDTAFQRRWNMRMIFNDINKAEHKNVPISDTSVTWGAFNSVINDLILSSNANMLSSEDKRLGAYFISPYDLKNKEDIDSRFSEKVIKYLWDDAFKFSRDKLFDITELKSLEDVITKFISEKSNNRFLIFKEDIRNLLVSKSDSNLTNKSTNDVIPESNTEVLEDEQ